MKVGGEGLTLTSLMQAAEGAKDSQKLLSKDGQEVHTHSSWKMHRFGDSAQQQRLQKAENGAEAVKTALNNEFGHVSEDFADKVFQAVNQRHGKDLSSAMTVGDLKLVKQEADRLSGATLTDDIRTVLDAGGLHNSGKKVTGELTERLMASIKDQDQPQDLRDQAVKTLGNFLSKNSSGAEVLKEALGKRDESGNLKALEADVFQQMFSLTDSEGTRALSNEDLHNITATLIRDETSKVTVGDGGGGILRGNTHASRSLTATYSMLDGGILPKMGNDVFNLAKSADTRETVLTGLDELLMDYSMAEMPELKSLFSEVEKAIDESNLKINSDQEDPTVLKKNQLSGSGFVLNSVFLRVVNPVLMQSLPEAEGNGKKMVMDTMKVLQQATAESINPSLGDITEISIAFKQDSEGLRTFHESII